MKCRSGGMADAIAWGAITKYSVRVQIPSSAPNYLYKFLHISKKIDIKKTKLRKSIKINKANWGQYKDLLDKKLS